MTKKIFRKLILVAFITIISCIVLFLSVLFKHFEYQLVDELKNQTVYLVQGLTSEGISYFDDLENTGSRITWIDSDGTVLYDNEADIAIMENHADREEFTQAQEKGFGTSSRYSNTIAEKTIYYARRMNDGTVIRVSSTQYTVWVLIWGMAQPIAIIFLIVITLSAIFAYRMSKSIIKPINKIDLENPTDNEIYEELSPLLNKINNLNKEISVRIAEAERKRHEFTMITENMREGLIITDRQTHILSYNTSALKFFSITENINNKSILTLNRSEKFRKAVHMALKGQHSDHLLALDKHYYEVITNPVYNDEKISGIVMVILDVTEKEKRDILRREFTSNVSHELKTPLTGIYGTAEIIMNGMVKAEDIPPFIKNIYDESGRLITLIDDIIKLSQLDENSISDENEAVDLYGAAENVIELLKNKAEQKNVTVVLKGDHINVIGVRGILEEMIYNLCENAIKYNKEQGKVTVSVLKEETKIKLSVSDTGIGISPSQIDRVFERFYRVDKGRSKDLGGTGLGLSIVKHAATYHGAAVTIDSTVDVGTTVTVCWDNEKQ